MRHAIAILIAASSIFASGRAVASQEPSPSPAAASSTNVKIAGRDVPAPKRRTFVAPVFPPEAQAAGQRGIVILELLIDETGKVSTADVLRSVAPFDESALAAVRQWEYEVTKVDGKPVPVRLTVPITFALKLPELTRDTGIPELRQGASPFFPAAAKGSAKVIADVTLLPDGSVAEAAIREGDSPWAEAMLQTLRTWRFASDREAPPVAFQVRADFQPGPPPKIELKLSGLHTAEAHAPASAAAAAPTVATATTAPPIAATPPPAGSPVAVASVPTPVAVAPTPAPPVAVPAPTATPAPSAPRPTPVSTPTPAPVSTPAPAATPGAVSTPPLSKPVASATPPPIEVIPAGPAPASGAGTPGATVPPVPAPPRNDPGVSAVRDVTLAAGVPDLTKGRRPVAPPLARMSAASGTVQIQFSVDAAGSPSIQNVNGPDLLKEAARQAVTTWAFRRTTAERMYLVAVFSYDGDRAQAEVHKSE
jgi:TonB family protein